MMRTDETNATVGLAGSADGEASGGKAVIDRGNKKDLKEVLIETSSGKEQPPH